MSSPRNKQQLSLFTAADFGSDLRTWTIVAYAFDCVGKPTTEVIRPIVTSLAQALDNISARRDPRMHDSSFDLFSRLDDGRYTLAIPEDLHPAVAGMVERKLIVLAGFDGLERGVRDLSRDFRPAGYYEAGATWVLATPPGGKRHVREPGASQLLFDF